jgi:chromosome segregation protein
MYLKRLEMVGFKSFAERTRLEFEPGVTAIVGPNGCGKSNVVDALRWCLGEMSAKSLRSKVLADVIFNGSANRAPSNLSEVSMTFDNSQNRLPIDYSEVTITRRLFRSGESEYFLNKSQCRLKDIKELFLDTGIGEEGYSIIEQGRVEYVLSAKPEERRELFEEAAGVSKYKARREEALRRLDRTQVDLDRLTDVIALTKEQMDKIEAAVRKARSYQKIQDNLKSLEIAHALYESKQLEEQMESMRQAMLVMENDLHTKTSGTGHKEAELTDLRWKETQLGEKLVEMNRRLSEIDGAVSLAEQRQGTARERQAEIAHRDLILDGEINQGRLRREELAKMSEEIQGSLTEEAENFRQSAGVLTAAETAHSEKSGLLSSVQNVATEVQNALWKNTQDRTKLNNDLVGQRSMESRLEAQLQVHTKDLAKAEERLAQLAADLAVAEADVVSSSAALSQAEAAVQAAQTDVADRDRGLTEAQATVARSQEDLFRTQAQLEAQEEWESSDVYARGTQAVLGASLPGIHGPVGRLISVSTADEVPVRRALGIHVNDLVADSLEEARAAIDFLAKGAQGRARILVLDRLSAGAPGATVSVGQRALLDMVRVDSRFEPVVRTLLSGWISSEGTLYGEGILEGGSESSSGPVFDALRRENLSREIATLTEGLNAAQEARRSAEEARRVAAQNMENSRRQLESARVWANIASQAAERMKGQRTLHAEEIRLILIEIEKARQNETQVKSSAQALESLLEGLKGEETRLRNEWGMIQESLKARQEEAFAASSELAVAKERAHGHEERLRWKEKQLADVEAERQGLIAGLNVKVQERDGSAQRVDEQRKVEEDAARVIVDLMTNRREANDALEAVHTERRQLAESLGLAQTTLSDLRQQTEEMQNQMHEKKLQHSHAEFRRESVETHLKDKYMLTLAEAREAHPIPTEAVAQAELEKLRRRVEGLGPVNLAAPEEHAQLEERYNFLLSQQQDLVKAKEDLLTTVQKINASTRLNFKETFDKVRENFKTIYGQLFPGGEADVRLTDESDILNAGVDIFAQPPGKKLMNITLLSGGEKALTAVALLFAFFMVRPAPFAVLDEVDAPLDEANVTRFITLIKAFTDQSQFIMITHNKRSMETADTLYGVTMEVQGVSRILSARLKTLENRSPTRSPESVLSGADKS